jgi:hypothetical protein
MAATDVLHMAGHAPVRHVKLERTSPTERKYADKSDDEITTLIENDLGIASLGNGPDGRPLS